MGLGLCQILLFLSSAMAFRPLINSFARGTSRFLTSARMSTGKSPIGLLVTVEIKPERLHEFLEVMKIDAIDSCAKENGGCLKFDVLKHGDAENKFTFYEVYRDEAAIDFHKSTAHYQKWVDFKSTGAVLSQSVQKLTVPISASAKL
jgi:quinol monooxygenase YgiN